MINFRKHVPLFEWIGNYQSKHWTGDISAGLTVGVMLIPQGMAYAMLAGLPPIFGLYASTIPILIYAVFGTSRQLAVGPVAMVALLISSGVGQLADMGSSEYIALSILLALMVGAIQFFMGLFRLGFIVNFLSHPVIAGFTSAAALIIGFSQMKHLLGIDIPRGKVHETIINVYENFGQINTNTFSIGLTAVIILLLIKKIKKRIPGPLIVVLLGILGVYGLDLVAQGVKIVGDVPSGFPTIGIPSMGWSSIQLLLPTALTISLVSFMESIAVAKAIQKKHKDYEIDNNQELIGLGLANIFGAFFKSFPVTGGFSRTAVNDQSGAKTGMAAIISAILVILTLLFLTPYFYYLPTAILSAIIMVAVFGLIDIKEAKYLWKTDPKDFFIFMATAIGTLTLGIEEGILLGVVFSIVLVIYNISYPHVAILGRSPDGSLFRNLERFSEVKRIDHTIIVRLDARLYFANVNYFKEYVTKTISEHKDTKYFILDAKAINGLDSSGVHLLHDLIEEFERLGIIFYIANVKGIVRDTLYRSGLMEYIGKEHLFNNTKEAVQYIEHKIQPNAKHKGYATQTNLMSEHIEVPF